MNRGISWGRRAGDKEAHIERRKAAAINWNIMNPGWGRRKDDERRDGLDRRRPMYDRRKA